MALYIYYLHLRLFLRSPEVLITHERINPNRKIQPTIRIVVTKVTNHFTPQARDILSQINDLPVDVVSDTEEDRLRKRRGFIASEGV